MLAYKLFGTFVMNATQLLESLTCKTYRGKEIANILNELATLRLTVFREYPYL